MLLRREPGRAGGGLAEMEEPPEGVSERRQGFILRLAKGCGGRHRREA